MGSMIGQLLSYFIPQETGLGAKPLGPVRVQASQRIKGFRSRWEHTGKSEILTSPKNGDEIAFWSGRMYNPTNSYKSVYGREPRRVREKNPGCSYFADPNWIDSPEFASRREIRRQTKYWRELPIAEKNWQAITYENLIGARQ
jgi:hypothetical protein